MNIHKITDFILWKFLSHSVRVRCTQNKLNPFILICIYSLISGQRSSESELLFMIMFDFMYKEFDELGKGKKATKNLLITALPLICRIPVIKQNHPWSTL